jgi:Protein of unknown function with PCYCGC motif
MSSVRAALAVLAVTVGLTACGSSAQSASSAPASADPQTPASSAQPSVPAPAQRDASAATSADRPNDKWTHPLTLSDAEIPPLPVTPFAPARPIEVVRAVYVFAARHPEVLSHVPCFCGCESRGHHHNDDCFVAARDAKGRPTEWEPHGVG